MAVRVSAELEQFQDRIGHRFAEPELLVRSVTHGSLGTPTRPNNERLEFLGDRVLGLVMAEALFKADRNASEGQLAPRFNALVRREACADVATQIALGEVLKLGRSEMISGGRRKQALLADAMEAVIAAVYLDAGFEVARDMVLRLWGDRVGGVARDARDPKSALQELLQAQGLPPPEYAEIERTGPDHAPVFTVELRTQAGHKLQVKGAGTKRQVEQMAAQRLLEKLEGDDNG
ncbi:ribonuclease III [Paracoccus pacificus]|uniref:Ribonuclease 3 n=1 Tax=Paracoccus pacificus TaxID=1463598 RepID=A0ABW4RAE1_9RHOB